MDRSYIAFISYKHAPRDAAVAKEVHSLIEHYVIPRALRKGAAKLGVVFRDEEELPISSDLTDSICRALDASRYLIVICSKEAAQSPWVQREVDYFLQHHDARDAFVVLAGGEPKDVFPRALTHVQNPHTLEYQEVEPLALDVRADTTAGALKKLKGSIKKLYAAMLGCSYDSLVQREKTRRRRQALAVILSAVLLLSGFFAMLISKNRELSEKNDQLTQITQATLLRESSLLVKEADEALSEGDTAAAIEYASAALYTEGTDRPYYAPAERVLMEAMDVFDLKSDPPLMKKLPLVHNAPVSNMLYSQDGRYVYTIDANAVVRCFDTLDGRVIWQVRPQETDVLLAEKAQLYLNSKGEMLVFRYGKQLSALNTLTGQTVWSLTVENTIAQGLFLNEETQEFSFIEEVSSGEFDFSSLSYTHTDYNFLSYSLADASPVRSVPLVSVQSPQKVSFPASGPEQSAMYLDKNTFLCTLYVYDTVMLETSNCSARLCLVDLDSRTAALTEYRTQDIADTYNHLQTLPLGNNRVVIISKLKDSFMQCVDLSSGKTLWTTALEQDIYLSTTLRCHAFASRTCVIAGIGSNLYAVNLDDGSMHDTTPLSAPVISLWDAGEGMFGYTLSNGFSIMGWVNANGLYDSQFFGASLRLPATAFAQPWKGGPLQGSTTETSIENVLPLPVQEGGGSILCLSEDRLCAYHITAMPAPSQLQHIALRPENELITYIGSYLDQNPAGQVLMGEANLSDKQQRGLVMTDPLENTLTAIPLDEETVLTFSRYLLTKDGGVMALTEDGAIASISREGTVHRLSDPYSSADQYWRADAARQTESGSLLTARCSEKEITLWTDGEGETALPLPESVNWISTPGNWYSGLFRVGENGLMVLSHFDTESDAAMAGFHFYSCAQKKWTYAEDPAHGSCDRPMALAARQSLLAVYDEDQTLRIYSASSGLIRSIPVGLPPSSLLKMTFAASDQCLALFTRDGQFLLYSLESGEKVYGTITDTYLTDQNTFLWCDNANWRLYIRLGSCMLCLDWRTWEEILPPEKEYSFDFYNEATSQLCDVCLEQSFTRYYLEAFPVPTTKELLDMAAQVLQ